MSEPKHTPAEAKRSGWAPGDLTVDEPGSRLSPHTLLIGVVLLFVFVAVWASIGELDVVTRGDGRVITNSQVQIIQNLEGGIV